MPDRVSAVQKQKLDPCHLANKILFISTNNTKGSKRMLPLICNLKMSLGWISLPLISGFWLLLFLLSRENHISEGIPMSLEVQTYIRTDVWAGIPMSLEVQTYIRTDVNTLIFINN